MTEYLCEANAPLLWPTVYLMTMAGVVIAATFAVLAALLDKANNRLPVAMLQTWLLCCWLPFMSGCR